MLDYCFSAIAQVPALLVGGTEVLTIVAGSSCSSVECHHIHLLVPLLPVMEHVITRSKYFLL